MHFKITARTILQLGSELISSDAIAFYELIKNSFDAKSKKVEVRIVKRLALSYILEASKVSLIEIQEEKIRKFEDLKGRVIDNLDMESFEISNFRSRIIETTKVEELVLILKKANFILIKDTGEGMSLDDLENIYLTIGTRNRRQQKTDDGPLGSRPILGEKGLGRLSVMRLGDGLRVETTQNGDEATNILEIDWNIFSHDSDALLESIDIQPQIGKTKTNPSDQGTRIYIYDLKEDWSIEKIQSIAKSQFGRFIDPFAKQNRDFITLWFNTKLIILEGIDRKLFDYAHASAKASLSFDIDGNPIFSGTLNYLSYNRQQTFNLNGTHLSSVINSPDYIDLIKNLGPFSTEFYWYNRKLLTVKEGVLEADYIKGLVTTWAGGLMVYRDGFRVSPYGGADDDWLSIDVKALASGGYKLNRRQLIGKVDISASSNPHLLDQTNREGLRENSEKQILVALLQFLIWKELKPFLDDVKEAEDQNIAALSLTEIEKRVSLGQSQVKNAVNLLRTKYPEINTEEESLKLIEDVIKESANLFKIAKASSEALEDRLKTTIQLAGLGLMVDIIAHELNRTTEHAISTINSSEAPEGMSSTMSTLRTQLKTLQTRLKVLDPLGPSGRQHKTNTDLKKLILETLDSHYAQFKRHKIYFQVFDEDAEQGWQIKVVPGMIVQILENLLNNSVYWLKQHQNIDHSFKAKIEIRIERKSETISFRDNGPGIPKERKDQVFLPFFSTKPPGSGKGLGLYISKEIARYHKVDLYLLDDKGDNLNEFILNLKSS